MDAPRVLAVAAGRASLTIAVYSCARRVTTRGDALLAAGLVTTSGSVLWVTGAGERRRPVARAVGAGGRVRAPLPRRPAAAQRGAGWGSRPAARCRSRRCRCPRWSIAGLIVLLSHRPRARAMRDAAVAAGIAVGRLRGGRAALRASAGCGTSRTRTTRTRAGRTAARGRGRARSSTPSGTATCSWSLALALAGDRVRACVRAAPPGRAAPRDRRARDRRRRRSCCGSCLVFALLVWEPAMWRAHVAHLVPPLALLAALRPPPWPVLAVAARRRRAVLRVEQHGRSSGPSGYTGDEAALVRQLERFPSDALVISDDPGLGVALRPPAAGRLRRHVVPAHRRRRRSPQASLVRRPRRADDVCGVIVSSPMHFGRFDGLGRRARGRAATTARPRSARAHHAATPHAGLPAVTGRPATARRRTAVPSDWPRRSNQRSGGTASITPAERHQLGGDVEREQHEHHRRGGCLASSRAPPRGRAPRRSRWRRCRPA